MRTQQQISDQMDAVQAQFPELANLTSKSNTAVFGLIRNIWIAAQLALDHYVDGVLANLKATAAAARVGTLQWYVDQVKAFQYGDPIAIVNGRVGYDVVDPSKRIITQAAATEDNGRLAIKAAKPSTDLYFQALSDAELSALKDYVGAVKYAGVSVDVISLPADELLLEATVKYDRQLMNSQGQSLTNQAQYFAHEAVVLYIRSLPFNSVLNGTELTAFVLKYTGIDDFVITRMGIRPAGSTEFTYFNRETTSRAGHVRVANYTFNYV